MAKVCVQGDTVDPIHKSVPLIATQGFFTINGKAAHLDGDLIQDHKVGSSWHKKIPIKGTGFLTVNGRKVVVEGDASDCGATILTASGFLTT